MSLPDHSTREKEAIGNAIGMGVWCHNCGEAMQPKEVVAYVMVPQYLSTRPYAIIRFCCNTNDCCSCVELEVDL